MRKRILLGTLCLLMTITAGAQSGEMESAREAVENMRVGWNLGNTLESNSGDLGNMWIEAWTDRSPSAYEKAWGQPQATEELIRMFKEAGFNAIRVPVTWYPHMEATFNSVRWDNTKQSLTPWDKENDDIGTEIQKAWMKRVHEVVDYVIGQGMYCILNIHHDTGASDTAWLVASQEDYEKQKGRFEAIWRQIAEEFKDYGDHLLFEGYNEMLDPYDSWCFASFGTSSNYNATVASSAYKAINGYAQSFVDAVRATGGNNAQRNLIVSTYGACSGSGTWSSHLQDPLKQMKLPADEAKDHLLFEIHCYLDIKNLTSVKKDIDQTVRDAKQFLADKGAPVIFGEWGTTTDNAYANYRSNMLEFARYFVEKAKANGMATFYWMGLSDGEHRTVPEFHQPDLKEAIMKGYYGEEGYTDIRPVMVRTGTDDTMVDLMGRRIARPTRGIYIRGGRKYVVK